MTTIIIFIISIIILYKLFSSKIVLFFIERKIAKMRPPIISYLHKKKTSWEETLRKFNENDKVVRDFYSDDSRIISAIDNIKKDLDIDNSYQILKQKFRKKPQSQLMLAHNYIKLLECLDYFNKTSGIDISILSETDRREHIEFSTKVGEKRQYIYKIFEELLNT